MLKRRRYNKYALTQYYGIIFYLQWWVTEVKLNYGLITKRSFILKSFKSSFDYEMFDNEREREDDHDCY